MFIPSGIEWIFLVVIVIVLLFGVKRIPEIARSVGKASFEFKKAKLESEKELNTLRNQKSVSADRNKLESIAQTLDIDYTTKDDEELKMAIEDAIRKKPE